MQNIPLPKNHEIRYYVLSSKLADNDNDFGYARISAVNSQTEDTIWVEIVADHDDLTWKGSTNLMQFNLSKRSLNEQVTKLTNVFNNELILKDDAAKNYQDLNKQILSAQEFKNATLTKYKIEYFTWNDDLFSYGWHRIDQEEKPMEDYIYVEITASDDDPIWKGETERISIWLDDQT